MMTTTIDELSDILMRRFSTIQALLEYKHDITVQRMGEKVGAVAGVTDPKRIDRIITNIEKMDPSRNNQYTEWAVRQFTREVFRMEDGDRVRAALTFFDANKRRFEEKDINKYTLHSLEDAVEAVEKLMGKEKTDDFEESDDTDVPGAKVLYKGPLGYLAIPTTAAASCELGAGTRWCTAAKGNNMFNHYSKPGAPLYIWKDKSGKYQFHFQTMQFMDSSDRQLSPDALGKLLENPILKKLFDKAEDDMFTGKDKTSNLMSFLARMYPGGMKDKTKEARFLASAHAAVSYAQAVRKGPWPEAEDLISKDAESSYAYARNVLKHRFKEGEPAILMDAKVASKYAIDVVKGRWKASEKIISTDDDASHPYVRHIRRHMREKGVESPKHLKDADDTSDDKKE